MSSHVEVSISITLGDRGRGFRSVRPIDLFTHFRSLSDDKNEGSVHAALRDAISECAATLDVQPAIVATGLEMAKVIPVQHHHKAIIAKMVRRELPALQNRFVPQRSAIKPPAAPAESVTITTKNPDGSERKDVAQVEPVLMAGEPVIDLKVPTSDDLLTVRLEEIDDMLRRIDEVIDDIRRKERGLGVDNWLEGQEEGLRLSLKILYQRRTSIIEQMPKTTQDGVTSGYGPPISLKHLRL